MKSFVRPALFGLSIVVLGTGVAFLATRGGPSGSWWSRHNFIASTPEPGPSGAVDQERKNAEGVAQRVAQSKILPDAMELWQQPSTLPAMMAFQDWANRFLQLPAAAQTAAVSEGIRLATERRALMHQLIALDPQKALQSAVPESVRSAMPASISNLLERRVEGRGDLEVTGKTPGDQPLEGPGVVRKAVLGGENFQAFVYGRREAQPSRWNVPLQGVALDGRLAVSETPGRVLEPSELAVAKPVGPDPVCPVSLLPTQSLGTQTATKVGKEVDFFCGRAHASAHLQTLAEKENLLPPGFGLPTQTASVAASGGAGVAVPNVLPDGDAKWTRGNKRIVIVRVNFNGANFHKMQYSDCSEVVNRMDAAWNRWSYGRCRLLPVGGGSAVTPVLNLSNSSFDYSEDDISDIWSDAESWADDQGHPKSSYDYLMVIAGDAGITQSGTDDTFPPVVTWTGLGRVGGPYTFLRATGDTVEDRIAANVFVGLHELGHNLGLLHASSTFTTPKVLLDLGGFTVTQTGEEYGDRFDKMGHGSDDYSVHYKNWLHWLDDGEVPVAISDGRYTIYEHDLGERGGGARGLQVPFSPGLIFFDSLFVEYRLFNTAAPYLTRGPTIRLGLASGPKTYLLDGTPETANDGSLKNDLGTWDSQLLPGRTFSYSDFGLLVHITTLSADPESGAVELMVKHGTPPGNHAPTGTILPWSAGAVGQMVYFTADASDADGDDLSFYWEAEDATDLFPTDPTIGFAWKTAGTKTVKCTVSDMQGGVTTLTYDISIVPNKPPTIVMASTANTDEDHAITIHFSVSDPTLDPSAIKTAVTSQNLGVVSAAGLAITSDGGGNRSLTVTPLPNQHGVVPLLITASDGSLQASHLLRLTVNPVTPGIGLVASGATWSYWDVVDEPSAGWVNPGFREVGWKRDTARFVFNQGLFVPQSWTQLSSAPGRVTTYYRKTFIAPSTLTGVLTMRLLCDDGAVVYLNGQEVARQNMADGKVTGTTRALRNIEGVDESSYSIIPLDRNLLNAGGLNVVAVEVHDCGGFSQRGGYDVSFDAELGLLEAPTLGRIPNMTIPEDTVLGPVNLGAADSESPPGELIITGTSSNPDVIESSAITITHSKLLGYRFTITPRTNANGAAEITLKASDGSSIGTRAFRVVVTPVNDPPTIDPIPSMTTAMGELPAPILVTVGDVDNDPAGLVLTATSGNPGVVQNANITVTPGPAPHQRWLIIKPTPGVFAQATIQLKVSDGLLIGSTSFLFRVSEPLLADDVNVTLVSSGADWRYWFQSLPVDGRGNPIDWTAPLLNDRSWPHGPAQLGYGGNGERTTIGPLPFRVTTYFRNSFLLPDPSVLASLRLRVLRDDGVVVFLNGVRVYANNMPRGTITPTTLASTDISGIAEQLWVETSLDLSSVHPGRNYLAVELHQASVPSVIQPGDATFDLELQGIPKPASSEDVLIPQGDLWSYWDDKQYPGDTWRESGFDASKWEQGLGRFGFGIGGITTVLDDGVPGFRRPSVLLRRVFDVSDPSYYSALHLFLQRDDGVVVYLNGARVLSDNVSLSGTVTNWALGEVPPSEQIKWRHYLLDPKALLHGRNLLAVELHQSAADGTDMNFDAQLSATLSPKPPTLFIRSIASGYEISWPSAFDDWILKSSTSVDPTDWKPVAITPLSFQGWVYLQYPGSPAEPRRFFQLTPP